MNQKYEEQQTKNRHEFWSVIMEILKKDWSQTCNNAPGTNIRIESNGDVEIIIIETGISSSTLRAIMKTPYLLSCEDKTGKLQVENIVLGGDE